MNVWTDGVSVLLREWRLVGVVLVFVFTGQSLTVHLIRKIFGDRPASIEFASLGLAGWLVPASLVSLFWYFTGFNWIIWVLPAAWILYLLLRLPLRGPHKPDFWPASAPRILLFALTVFLSILLRLTYVSKALFPLYFDSAQHYIVIKNIMGHDAVWMYNWLKTAYYHLGFHFLTAYLASITHATIISTMLVLGQVILALIPFSLFFPVRNATKSNMAGWFTVVLSAFGWYMPAHAVDWGKYPALMSMGMIPFVLGLAYLFSGGKNEMPGQKRWIFYGLLGLSALLTIFTHSRSMIILALGFLAWIASTWWGRLTRRQMSFTFLLAVFITLAEVVFIQRQSILALLVDPYLQKGPLITALVLFLAIFAWMAHPRLTFVSVLTVTLLLASIFIPVPIIPGYRDLTLLDRPFVEMILFMPLSVLGGLGLAGLIDKLSLRFIWGRYVGVILTGVVLVNAFFSYNLYPSDCCVIVGNDDVVALDWVANQLPVDARIGIASTELKVLSSDTSEGDVGADAGIWITPLTGLATFPLPYDSKFEEQSTLDVLCELEIDYLYVGEAGQPFDYGKITSRPEWYRPLLSMPGTWVYKVVGCGN